jgi:hypothetical protein
MRRTAVLVAVILILPAAAMAQTTTWVQQFGTAEYEEVWGSLVVDQTCTERLDGGTPGPDERGRGRRLRARVRPGRR